MLTDSDRVRNNNLHTIAKNLYDISRQLRLMNEKLQYLIPESEKNNPGHFTVSGSQPMEEKPSQLGEMIMDYNKTDDISEGDEEDLNGNDTDAD